MRVERRAFTFTDTSAFTSAIKSIPGAERRIRFVMSLLTCTAPLPPSVATRYFDCFPGARGPNLNAAGLALRGGTFPLQERVSA
jgi:hypothetical protein